MVDYFINAGGNLSYSIVSKMDMALAVKQKLQFSLIKTMLPIGADRQKYFSVYLQAQAGIELEKIDENIPITQLEKLLYE